MSQQNWHVVGSGAIHFLAVNKASLSEFAIAVVLQGLA